MLIYEIMNDKSKLPLLIQILQFHCLSNANDDVAKFIIFYSNNNVYKDINLIENDYFIGIINNPLNCAYIIEFSVLIMQKFSSNLNKYILCRKAPYININNTYNLDSIYTCDILLML